MPRWNIPLATVLLFVILGMSVLGFSYVQEIGNDIKVVISQNTAPERIMQTAETTVTNTSGITVTVKTTRLKDETTADWANRHLEAVLEFKNS